MSMTQYERETGLVHEQSNYSAGNEPVPDDVGLPKTDPAVKKALIEDMRDAFASGPFTGGIPG